MLTKNDKHYIHKTLEKELEAAIKEQDDRSKKRDLQLGNKIEDLRNDMADEFLRNRQEHAEIRQEISDFKQKMTEFKYKTLAGIDQILGELKAMRENYVICSFRREENTAAVVQLDHRVTRAETHLGLEDVE
jgi:beta-phosphoglucomutase-like phosphatase (HAD superfamily)